VDNWVYHKAYETPTEVSYANDDWIGAKVFNLQNLQKKISESNKDDEINMSEFRATAEIDLKKWCEDHGKDPAEFLFNKNNTTSAVEVRVIRITPNYMDETKSTKDYGPWTYQDQVTWNYIVTETFDPEIDYDEIRRRAENEMHSLEAAGVKHVFGRRTYTGEDMRENGWSEFTDDDTIVTVYSHTVSSNGRHYLITPCAWNESKGQHLLSKSDFESAVAQFLFIRQDLEGIVLYSSTNIEDCNDVAKRLHNAHEIWYCVEEPTTKAEEKALPLSLMMDSRPVSDSKYKKACFLTLRCKLDTVGNIEGQLSRLSVVAQAFSPYWDGAKWFPMNLKSGYKYYSEPNDKKKRTLLVDGEKTAKEQYEYKRMVGLDAIRTKGGNNWKSLVDAEIFDHVISEHSSDVNPTYSSNGKNVYITDDALKFLEDESGLLNTPANAFALTVIGQQCGIDAKDFGEINELSLGEWYEQLQAVKDGRVNDDGTDFELRFGCNAYLYSGVKVEDVLSKIASSGRAAYTRDDNGKLIVVMDNPVEYPRGVLNSENALGTTITYNFNLSPSGLMINFKNEANNYQDFGLPVMDDGEDYRNPTKAIEQGAVDFVTNIDQIYSLGRFVMANSIFGKKAISWKAGIEGYDINFGEVYAVSTDILLIGLANARIADLILSKDGTKCYGVILTDTYEFDGRTKDGRSIYGIEIHQPGQYEESKVVTIRFNNGEGITDGENRVNCQQIGVTNKVVFEAPISLVGRTLDNGVSYNFNPQQGNNVNIGEIGKISELYRVKSKTPEDKGTFTLQLVKYDPEFYNYGKALPKIKSNTSMIQTDTDSVVTVSGLVPAEYVNESNNTQRKELSDALSDITVDTPYILSVNGSNVIKNGDGSVTLTPTLFKGATQIDTVPSEMKIQWYVDNVASLGYGPGRFVDESILELTGEDVSDKVLVTCKLEDIQRYVAGFEDESGEILYSGFLDEDTSKADREYLEGFQDATRSL
ncbi:hypothetical protein, partial [Treponema sp.]|uniref:hypothetical protein n=1 Tax=Treponema sp. TaxID=166 RepID=UPI00298E61A3